MNIIPTVFQPFTQQPKKKTIILSIAAVWVVSFALALIPALEKHSHDFYQSVSIKPNVYFKQREVTFKDVRLLASKLFVYNPELKNVSKIERDEILKTNSWILLGDFLNKTVSGGFEINGFYG